MKPTITTGFDRERAFILESRELGAVMAVLVNALDPQALGDRWWAGDELDDVCAIGRCDSSLARSWAAAQ